MFVNYKILNKLIGFRNYIEIEKNCISNINSINGTSRRERHLAACSRGIVGRWPPTALPRNYRLRPVPLSPYWHVRDAFYLLGRSCMDLS